MRALVIDEAGPASKLALRDIPMPEPGPGEARVRVAYSGLNPLDVMARAGLVNWMPVSFPFTPGLEHTGIVDAVGQSVSTALIGSRVLSRSKFGGCADYSVSDASRLIPLDARIDFKTGCAYRGGTYTAWHLLHLAARAQAGDTLLVHSAAGMVGLMLTQIAKEMGLTVIGLAGGVQKLDFAREFGADHLIDYSDPAWPDQVQDVTDGCGADLVIDGNSGANAAHNVAVTAPLGRIIYIGAVAGGYAEPIAVPMLIGKSISVGGFTLTSVEVSPDSKDAHDITDAVASGRWRIPITEDVPLDQAAQLHHKMETRKICGRAVIRIDDSF